MKPPINERDLSPAKRELLGLFRQASDDEQSLLLAFVRVFLKAQGQPTPTAAGEPSEEVSAIQDELWDMAGLINQGVPVCGSPCMVRAAEAIAEVKREQAAKITHPFDPDRTIGGSL